MSNEASHAPVAGTRDREQFPRPAWLPMGLNWAVTGASGLGKSAFLNGIRGLEKGDEDYAQEGIIECTMEAKPFPLPDNPNVRLWDLPGSGTTKHPEKEYIRDKGLRYFQGVILMVRDGRPTEFDVKLTAMLQELHVPFYIVQNRFQQTLDSEGVDPDDPQAWKEVADRIAIGLAKSLPATFNRRPYCINSRRFDLYEGSGLYKDVRSDLKLQAPKEVFDEEEEEEEEDEERTRGESADPTQAKENKGEAAKPTAATAASIPVAEPCIFNAASSSTADQDLKGYFCSLGIPVDDAAMYATKLEKDGFDSVLDLKAMTTQDGESIEMKKLHIRKVMKAVQAGS